MSVSDDTHQARTSLAGNAAADAITSLGEVWRVELARGLKRLAAGRFDEAERYFLRAYRRRPRQPEVCFALGRERLRQERFAEAEALLRVAWERDPALHGAAAALARCLGIGLDRYYEAYRALDEAEEQHPREAGLLVVRGELLVEEGRGLEARAVFDRALALVESTPRAGGVSTRVAITAGLARAYNLEGIELGKDGRVEEALFAFKRASDLDPDWSGPVVNMGVAFAQLGRHARAVSCYERALVKDPRNPVAHFNLANLARDAGQLARAQAAFQSAMEADADYPGVRVGLARVLCERGNPRAAIEVLKEEMGLQPDEPEVWTELGLAYRAAGDGAHAETYLRGALALSKDHAPALCELARLLVDEGRAAEADLVARRAHEVDAGLAAERLGILGRGARPVT